MNEDLTNRLAVLTSLVKKSPGQDLGRTAVMKLVYFLTALRNVPLGYRFSLYSYGPFDATVLRDVDYASNLGALRCRPVSYQHGSGYSIQPDAASSEVESYAQAFLEAYEKDIDWVVKEFGHLSAVDLELASTVVYIDHELISSDPDDLARRVHDVKPHFDIDRIMVFIKTLSAKGLIMAN